MKKNILIWIAVIFSAIFFVIGIPILINEAYKCNSYYITMWGAPEVLSYYGTILGSVIAVATLSVTVLFTRKQIERASYLNSEKEKWSKIEENFAKALVSINPLRPLMEIKETKQTKPFETITTFQTYQMRCRSSMDEFLALLNNADYPRVKELFEKASTLSEEYFQIAEEEIAVYKKWLYYMMRDNAQSVMETESKHPNSSSAETIAFYQEILDETEGLQSEDIQASIKQAGDKMVAVYETTYRPLLQLKGATFETIRKEIQIEADNILHLRRKK